MASKAEITISHAEHGVLHNAGIKLQGASIHHTMGPNFREIVWIERMGGKVPHVCQSHTVLQIKAILGK